MSPRQQRLAQIRTEAKTQALQDMEAWKDAAYQTIEDFRTALKAPSKTQDEMIGMARKYREYYEEMADLNGPFWMALKENRRLKQLLCKAAYPRRGTEEESMTIMDFANEVQQVISHEEAVNLSSDPL